MTLHRVWLYFTDYAWADVLADTYDEAQKIAWAWQKAGFPKGEVRDDHYAEVIDWGY